MAQKAEHIKMHVCLYLLQIQALVIVEKTSIQVLPYHSTFSLHTTFQ